MALLPHTLCLSIHERCLVGNTTPNWAATSLLRPRPNCDAQVFVCTEVAGDGHVLYRHSRHSWVIWAERAEILTSQVRFRRKNLHIMVR